MAPGSCEDNYAIPASTRQENQIRPPISPRKSIRKLDDQTVNGKASPVYEYVKDVSTQDYSEELDLEHISSLNEYKIRSLGLGLTKQKGLNDYDIAPSKFPSLTLGQHTEIFTYPVVGEFPGRGRSSSAPFTSANEESVQSEAPSARPRSASTDQESAASTSVRDKIRAFEEVISTFV